MYFRNIFPTENILLARKFHNKKKKKKKKKILKKFKKN